WDTLSGAVVDDVLVVFWMDNGPVTMLTTIHEILVHSVFGNASKKILPISTIIDNYNYHMGGVDVADQLKGYYGTQVPVCRTWMPLFFWLLDTSIINTFLISKALNLIMIQSELYNQNSKKQLFYITKKFELPIDHLLPQSYYPIYREERGSCVWCQFQYMSEYGKHDKNSPQSQFIPSPRYYQTSVLDGIVDGNYSNEVIFLDLAKKFETNAPPWSVSSGTPEKEFLATSCLNSINGSNIFLIGGLSTDQAGLNVIYPSSLLYTFNPDTLQWTTTTTTGFFNASLTLTRMNAVVTNNGNIFIFGGIQINSINNKKRTGNYINYMNILNVNTLKWSQLNTAVNVPTPRGGYTANLLNNSLIIYIGGLQLVATNVNSSVDMNEQAYGDAVTSRLQTSTQLPNNNLYLFDVQNNVWISSNQLDSFKTNSSSTNSPSTNSSTNSSSPNSYSTPSTSQNLNGIIIAISVVGGLIFIAIIAGLLYFIKSNNRSDKPIPTPGEYKDEIPMHYSNIDVIPTPGTYTHDIQKRYNNTNAIPTPGTNSC
ncbi:16551_t:CDS:2, partial [Cetraspora pellucida]